MTAATLALACLQVAFVEPAEQGGRGHAEVP